MLVTVTKQIDLDVLFEGERMVLFESLEDSDANHHYLHAMCNQLILPPQVYPNPYEEIREILGTRNEPFPWVEVTYNRSRPYLFTYGYPGVLPDFPLDIAITDPTHNKKGLLPKTILKQVCTKVLRNRAIIVFEIEWMEPAFGVKKETV